jgi:hypothetical protein
VSQQLFNHSRHSRLPYCFFASSAHLSRDLAAQVLYLLVVEIDLENHPYADAARPVERLHAVVRYGHELQVLREPADASVAVTQDKTLEVVHDIFHHVVERALHFLLRDLHRALGIARRAGYHVSHDSAVRRAP